MRAFVRLVAILSIAFLPLPSDGAKLDVRAQYTKYEFRIPMRDGKRLFTAVYVPKERSSQYPFLITRTPYGVEPYGVDRYPQMLEPGEAFARDGFIFVYQDVRGRNMSEGTWTEMTPHQDHKSGTAAVDESTDTYDTIEWLLHNVPGNNGKAGLIGVSYPGFYATAGMMSEHPALVAVSPQAPIADLYMGDDAYHNGAFFLAANFSFYTGFPRQENPKIPIERPKFNYGTKDGYKFYLGLGSLQNADEKYFKYGNPYWSEMIAHPSYDAYWKARNILPHIQNIKPAVLVVGGWFDAEDLSGTLKTYRAVKTQSPQTTAMLAMGPWHHGGWSSSHGASLGDITFGSNTSDDFQAKVELPFFRHYLKGAPGPKMPTAYVFETGKNEWEQYGEWPPANARPVRLYLLPHGKLGFELAGASGPEYDQYVSDPNKPVPYFDGIAQNMTREYMDADQRFAARRTDVLTYETGVLEQDLTIAGPIAPTLHVSSTGTDSDFVVKLIDVYPDDFPNGRSRSAKTEMSGYEQLVRGEPFRAKFRHGFEKGEPLTPGKIEEIHFAMPDTNHCFRRGHRIMVQVQSSWFPLVDRNPQVFTNIPTAQAAQFTPATERVYHSAAHPSFLDLLELP